jgi:hypothetical protein
MDVCLKQVTTPVGHSQSLDLAELLVCLLRRFLNCRRLKGLKIHVVLLPGQVLGVVLDARCLPKTKLV